MVLGHLQHLVIAFGIKIHEVVVHRVHVLSLHYYLIVQMRSRALSRVSAECNLLATDNLLPLLYKEILVE